MSRERYRISAPDQAGRKHQHKYGDGRTASGHPCTNEKADSWPYTKSLKHVSGGCQNPAGSAYLLSASTTMKMTLLKGAGAGLTPSSPLR